MGIFSRKPKFIKIGTYQFNNLVSNPISFLLIDLRPKNEKPFLQKSTSLDVDSAIDFVQEKQLPKDSAIVVICETGQHSEKLGQKLGEQGFINVVVLEGGTQSLSS